MKAYRLKLVVYIKTTRENIDKKTLKDIFQEETVLTEIDKTSEKENNCDKCGSRLIVVHPYKWMNEMILCECENCKERCYRKP